MLPRLPLLADAQPEQQPEQQQPEQQQPELPVVHLYWRKEDAQRKCQERTAYPPCQTTPAPYGSYPTSPTLTVHRSSGRRTPLS